MQKIYPDSEVELTPLLASFYDQSLNILSLCFYGHFIQKAINAIPFDKDDSVLDLGCGTGKNACIIRKNLSKNAKITGLDISKEMEKQFINKCSEYNNVFFKNQRIDIDFDLQEKFDKVFISFVIHGFPHEIRQTVIKNAYNHLKPGGQFIILDYSEFDIDKIPSLHNKVFRLIECKYAFDYIKRDWKGLLREYGFSDFQEHFFFKKYVRLLIANKV